jgi:hypothetical protein
MNRMWKWLLGTILMVGISLVPGQVQADLLITLSSTAPSGSNTAYTYNVFLAPGFELDKTGFKGNASTGSVFTLYDFVGLVGTPTVSAALSGNGFTAVTTPFTGTTPSQTAPTDSATIGNISIKYTKSTETNNPANGMNLFLGQFTAVSTFGPSSGANITYAAATQKNLPGSLEDELLANNISQVVGPNVVPEPATALSISMTLPVLGGLLYLRRRAKSGRAYAIA